MKRILLYVPCLILAACGGDDKKTEANSPQSETTALTQSKNSASFNSSFEQVLNSYYALKDGLVASKDASIASNVDASAKQLQSAADSLKLDELQGDNAIKETAKSFSQTISSEAAALVGKKNLEEKRSAFKNISDALYTLVRTVRYDRQKMYLQHCPMAFNDTGADWLSRTSDIKNPYFGSKMLTCGEVTDSLDFSKQ